MNYFQPEHSVFHFQREQEDDVIKVIANRFIAKNPQEPYTYRADFTSGILCNRKGQYLFDFEQRFPAAKIEEVCFAAGNLYSSQSQTAAFQLQCYGPTVCQVNGETVFASDAHEEGFRKSCIFKVNLLEGDNTFLFSTEKTEIGFGFTFGHTMPQWVSTHFKAPLSERKGQSGFIYSPPSPDKDFPEDMVRVSWFPKQTYEGHSPTNPLDRIFGTDSAGIVFAKTTIQVSEQETVTLHGIAEGKIKAYVDGVLCFNSGGGEYEKELTVARGRHTLILQIEKLNKENSTVFQIQAAHAAIGPYPVVEGYEGQWLYTGPFAEQIPSIEELSGMNAAYTSKGQSLYWRIDLPDGVVRIFAEQSLYGRWTYPMGVTLYGLLETGKWMNRKDYIEYVQNSVNLITQVQECARYDKELFGYPGVNTQICWLEELDDCGSFGSLMLEATKGKESLSVKKLADEIAHFMRFTQRREEDGTFSRGDQTMWIDDMYMSIPFMCRYYQLSGDVYYLEEACRQALGFKEYLFIANQNLMSHIYFTSDQKANKIPWSRGNGWVIFSLSELLAVLTKESAYYHDIVTFYNQMAKGILDVQGARGMWHQVLDQEDTYEETSATAMFICALSRGYRLGYLEEKRKQEAVKAIDLAWDGLKKIAVNRYGDVYGVCQGSGRSFSRNYYKNLSWRFNDAHGIGIVMLAGIEKLKIDKTKNREKAC